MSRLIHMRDGAEVAGRITFCDTPWTRARGLLGVRALDPGHVYWIRPCNAIHTFFMCMTIDAVFVDADLRVVKLVPSMTPFRVCLPVHGAKGVIEGAEGLIERSGLRTGDQLRVEGEPGLLDDGPGRGDGDVPAGPRSSAGRGP